ncbi:hypothetical protein MERGE_000521 [Pneumocystis wakefieldiae]|uniref:Phosphatidylglycerol/phosphatidylinositol transfer protein n=1 Tax=Pneumocystis wakefieldiae TaxID=38082 RepID=A0A899G009_9ASCO|nr:hypothetical protein MERGE_000521 [Pneumocystis wakefieldiae]
MKIHVITLIVLLCKQLRIKANSEVEDPFQGSSIISFCPHTDPNTNILKVKSLKITPDPPKRDSLLIVEGWGTLSEDVTIGSYISLSVAYGIVPILNLRADLCKQTEREQFPCPISKGEYNATREFHIPSHIFPGRYIIKADIFLENNKRIACFVVDVTFTPKFLLNYISIIIRN